MSSAPGTRRCIDDAVFVGMHCSASLGMRPPSTFRFAASAEAEVPQRDEPGSAIAQSIKEEPPSRKRREALPYWFPVKSAGHPARAGTRAEAHRRTGGMPSPRCPSPERGTAGTRACRGARSSRQRARICCTGCSSSFCFGVKRKNENPPLIERRIIFYTNLQSFYRQSRQMK